eukprot:3601794-Amphidinium_carterae.1
MICALINAGLRVLHDLACLGAEYTPGQYHIYLRCYDIFCRSLCAFFRACQVCQCASMSGCSWFGVRACTVLHCRDPEWYSKLMPTKQHDEHMAHKNKIAGPYVWHVTCSVQGIHQRMGIEGKTH